MARLLCYLVESERHVARSYGVMHPMIAAPIACLLAGSSTIATASGQRVADPVAPPASRQSDAVQKTTDDAGIVVMGKRLYGSVIADIEPVAVLDQNALRTLGATNIKQLLERLAPISRSSTGEAPVLLVNGRRISGFEELQGIPPEAIERTEVLPEQEAARFGFAPTVRVMNFVTMKRFRAVTIQQLAGTTTEGGGETNFAELISTRIDGPRRISLNVSHLRLNPLLQSQRDIVPDPTTLFAIGGNITGREGGSIDPRLDALSGPAVTVAAVPGEASDRRSLASYLAGAGSPAVTDVGRYRSLQQRSDRFVVDGTLVSPISKTVDGSINLSMEAQRSAGLNGLAFARLDVPTGGFLPFSDDVTVYRYLPDIILRQRSTNLTLHAAGTLQGAIGRWTWNTTGSFDRVRGTTVSDQGIAIVGLQASIDAGGDPLMPVDPGIGSRRLIDRSRTGTGTIVGKVVTNGPLLRLPAGPALLTVSADYARSSSSGQLNGLPQGALGLTRTISGASVNATLPIASAERDVLPFIGRLSANGMVGVSTVSGYGQLISSNYGMTWAPARAVQFSASVSQTQTAPAIGLLTAPSLTTPNTPFFDFTTGESVFVTTIGGGNPALDPERRRIMTLGIALQPFRKKELRVGVDYIDTHIRNQATVLGSATLPLQLAFPDRFRRDKAGNLLVADLRSINLATERERKLRLTASYFTQLGPEPPPPAETAKIAMKDVPPPAPPKPRPTLFTSVTTTLRFANDVTLRPGLPSLDLLDGATLDGTGGRPRWEIEGNIGAGMGPINAGIFARLQGQTRIRNALPEADLRFSARTWLVAYSSVDVERIVTRPWARRMSVQVTVENLLNDRIDVRDRTGATPNRYQQAHLDPLGRSIRLGLRKLF